MAAFIVRRLVRLEKARMTFMTSKIDETDSSIAPAAFAISFAPRPVAAYGRLMAAR